MEKLSSQLDAMQSLLDVNKLLDEKAHGQGLTFSTMDPTLRVKNGLSTGISSFDLITGGGFASSRFSYLYGDTGSAKSTTLYHGLMSALNKNIITIFNDHESSVDPTYLGKIGINLDDVCGRRNKKGTWEVTPKLRYSVGTTAEATFRFMNLTMKSLPDKVQMHDAKEDEFRYFLVSPDFNYKPTWAHINKGLKEKKVIEVEDFSPQMVFITDSLKAMLPEARDEDIDSDPIALLARCFSASFPLVKSLLGRKNCIYLATNHMTVNPMVKYGCLHGDTPVPFVDGRSYTMREIVDNKVEGDVWSYDEVNKKIIPAKIVDWHFNGNVEKPNDFITITCDAIGTANGVASFTCTRDHKVLTLDGWKPAEELTTDDMLISKYQSKINGTLKSFLLGTLVGDCCIQLRDESRTACRIRFKDSQNLDYISWKVEKLEEKIPFINKGKNSEYYSEQRHEFLVWKNIIGRRDPSTIIDQMDDLSLAVWYMDDGSMSNNNYGEISVYRLSGDTERLISIKDALNKKGIHCSVYVPSGRIQFAKDAFFTLCERICKYIPECMQYKLPIKFRNRYEDFNLDCQINPELEYVNILSVNDGSNTKFRQKGKYDISIEGTHNYMVGNVANGVVVHNSNESEPGGKAVQFYPDLKMKMHVNRAQSKIIEETHVSGEGVDRYIMGKATVIKNKSGPCFRSSEFRIWVDENGATGRGIDPVFDAFNFLNMTGLIEKIGKDNYGIRIAGWETQSFNWKKFKELVLIREEGKLLKAQIEQIISDGTAQEMYYATLAAHGEDEAPIKSKDEDPDDKIETIEL